MCPRWDRELLVSSVYCCLQEGGSKVARSSAFFKKRQRDSYSNFATSWFLSDTVQGIFYSLCCHVGEPFPIHWRAVGDLLSCTLAILITWTFLRKQHIIMMLSFGSCCFLYLQWPPPLIHLPVPYPPILKHWLKDNCGQAFPSLPPHLISNSPAELFLFPVFHFTLFIHWGRCSTGIGLAVTSTHLPHEHVRYIFFLFTSLVLYTWWFIHWTTPKLASACWNSI